MNRINAFNARFAAIITNAVATMWCAYGFAALALVSLPVAIAGGSATLVAWTAQTFLQLVLLSVIMVGQKAQADHTAAVKEHVLQIHDHLGIETTDQVDRITKSCNEPPPE